eukprot:gene18424-biopygen12956
MKSWQRSDQADPPGPPPHAPLDLGSLMQPHGGNEYRHTRRTRCKYTGPHGLPEPFGHKRWSFNGRVTSTGFRWHPQRTLYRPGGTSGRRKFRIGNGLSCPVDPPEPPSPPPLDPPRSPLQSGTPCISVTNPHL